MRKTQCKYKKLIIFLQTMAIIFNTCFFLLFLSEKINLRYEPGGLWFFTFLTYIFSLIASFFSLFFIKLFLRYKAGYLISLITAILIGLLYSSILVVATGFVFVGYLLETKFGLVIIWMIGGAAGFIFSYHLQRTQICLHSQNK